MWKIMKNDGKVMEFLYLFAEIINWGYEKSRFSTTISLYRGTDAK